MIIALGPRLLYTDFMWKLKWVSCIIIVLFGLAGGSHALAQEELPFWRSKPKLLKRISEQRKVVVSVDVEKERRQRSIRMLGVGVVNVPLYFAVEQIQRFEELPKVSSYFQKVRHDKAKKEVYFFIKALGKQVRFIQEYKWGPRTTELAQMDWRGKWVNIQGRVGHYKLRKISPQKTEVAIWVSMKKKDIPLPKFLLNFTLEVIAEKTAQKMRSFMESRYRNAKKMREDHVKKR